MSEPAFAVLHSKFSEGFAGYGGGIDQFCLDHTLGMAGTFRQTASRYGVLAINQCRNYSSKVAYDAWKTTFAYDLAEKGVAGGATNMAVLFIDWHTRQRWTCLGVIGDYDDIIRWLTERHMRSPKHQGVYYHTWMAGYARDHPVKLFLDIEWYEKWTLVEVGTKLRRVLDKLEAALPRTEEDGKEGFDGIKGEVGICGGFRTVGSKPKWSFHVTYSGYLFNTTAQLKQFVGRSIPMETDLAPLKARGHMRTPFTPKYAQTNKGSILREMEFDSNGVLSRDDSYAFSESLFRLMDPVPRVALDKFELVNCEYGVAAPTVEAAHRHAPADIVASTNPINKKIIAYFNPLRAALLTKIQEHRRKMLVGITRDRSDNQSKPRCGVPTDESNFGHFTATSMTGSFHVAVKGDTFCEHDAPDHFHSRGNNVCCLEIDLIHGCYKQLCYACGVTDKYYQLWDLGMFSITSLNRRPGHPLPYHPKGQDAVQTFIIHVSSDILWRTGEDSIYVYDSRNAIWCNDEEGRYILYTRMLEYCKLATSYLQASNQTQHDRRLEVYADDFIKLSKARAAFHAECLVEFKISREKWEEEIRSHYNTVLIADGSQLDMDIYPHLIPLQGCVVFNILTGEVSPRTQTMRITSCLDGSLIQTDDEQCHAVATFFMEVSNQRQDLATYLMITFGYCLSHLTVDRGFYLFHGTGMNGKGVLLRALQNVLRGGGTKRRYQTIGKDFFTKKANQATGAEAPTAMKLSLRGKSCCTIEELGENELDTELLKSISANDEQSGRGLYAKSETTFKPTCKLWFNTNKKINASDMALWDRLRFIPMDAKYSNNPKPGEYQADETKSKELEKMTDAFTTVCLTAAQKYFNGAARPLTLPGCVVNVTKKEKSGAFPLKGYIQLNTKKTARREQYGNLLCLFHAYRNHLRTDENERGFDKTYSKFLVDLQRFVPHDFVILEEKGNSYLEGLMLTDDCINVGSRFKDGTLFVPYSGSAIVDAIKRMPPPPPRSGKDEKSELELKQEADDLADFEEDQREDHLLTSVDPEIQEVVDRHYRGHQKQWSEVKEVNDFIVEQTRAIEYEESVFAELEEERRKYQEDAEFEAAVFAELEAERLHDESVAEVSSMENLNSPIHHLLYNDSRTPVPICEGMSYKPGVDAAPQTPRKRKRIVVESEL